MEHSPSWKANRSSANPKKYIYNWIGYILRRNFLLKRVIEGKIKGHIEVTRRRGRRRNKLLDDLWDRRGYSHLKEEALDRTKWRNRFGRGFGPVVWQIIDMIWYIYTHTHTHTHTHTYPSILWNAFTRALYLSQSWARSQLDPSRWDR
jgi:hypothetical protein